MPKESLFKLIDVTKKFGNKIVLDKISFDIPKGKIFGIIGPSGVGKTTLINILTAFYFPSSGKIFFKSKEIRKSNIKLSISMSTQHGSFYPNLSIEDNIKFFGSLYNLSKETIKKRAYPLLEKLEIYNIKDLIAGNLSKGIQKRLDIVCALLPDTDVVIFDEPMEDLDPILREKVVSIIKDLHKKGKSIVISSHFFKELEEICEELVIIFKGKVIEKGSKKEIENKYGHKNLEHIFLDIVKKDGRI